MASMRVTTLCLLALAVAMVDAQCSGAPNPQTTPLPLANFRHTSPWGGSGWQSINANSVIQTVNGQPTGFMSDFDGSLGQVVKGKISVQSSGDDDFLGFIFGLDCIPPAPANVTSCSGAGVLFDWKQGNQGAALIGTKVSTIGHWGSSTNPGDFWSHSGTVNVIATGNFLTNTGWQDFTEYTFVSAYTRSRLQIWIDDVLEFDVTPPPATFFPLGRNGFYGYSQPNTRYSDLEIVEAVGTHNCAAQPVLYTLDFNHSGGCSTADFSLEVIWDTSDTNEGTTLYPSPTTMTGTTGTFDISNVYVNPGGHLLSMQLYNGNMPEGPVVTEFALVRDAVNAVLTKDTPSEACGFDSRCDAPTARLFFSVAEGGTPTYTALWNDGDTTCCATPGSCSTCDSTRMVGAGTYDVELFDINGCRALSNPVTITESVVSSVVINEPSCGTITTNVVGTCSGPGFTYSWSTSDGCSSCLTPGAASQSGLSPGTYDVVVTDANGCTNTASHVASYNFFDIDPVYYMYIPYTWRWSGFQPGTTGSVLLEHTITGTRAIMFTGDVSATTSVEYEIHRMELGYVTLKFEASGSSSCFIDLTFYLCASPLNEDPMCFAQFN